MEKKLMEFDYEKRIVTIFGKGITVVTLELFEDIFDRKDCESIVCFEENGLVRFRENLKKIT